MDDAVEKKLDQIFVKLLNLEERVVSIEDKMVTKDEFYTLMDKQTVILERLDQERIFTQEWVRRIEADVNRI